MSRRQALAYDISLAAASACIVAAAVRHARQIGVSMFIAVVNDCSVIKMSSRMDGNSQASVTVVPPKAVTANAFRTPHRHAGPGGRRSDPARLDRRSRL